MITFLQRISAKSLSVRIKMMGDPEPIVCTIMKAGTSLVEVEIETGKIGEDGKPRTRKRFLHVPNIVWTEPT